MQSLLDKGWTGEGEPPISPRMPAYDDADPVGVSIFRMMVGAIEGETMLKLENLTLPKTFVGRSELKKISFNNTDLSESCFCWNDFLEVDFRHSAFSEGCDFTGANMPGVKLTVSATELFEISKKQEREIDWQDDDGEEPGGG